MVTGQSGRLCLRDAQGKIPSKPDSEVGNVAERVPEPPEGPPSAPSGEDRGRTTQMLVKIGDNLS